MTVLTLATRNPGKADEFNRILASLPGGLRAALPPDEFSPVDEVADTYEGNARLKAEALGRSVDGWVLADDSGLEVEALGGAPGIRSARYGQPERPGLDDAGRRALLLERLAGIPHEARGARFVCVLALGRGGTVEATFRGECRGRIVSGPGRGEGGFGYDPIFLFPGTGKTFGEMPDEEKDRHSHRAQALWQLASYLTGRPGPREP